MYSQFYSFSEGPFNDNPDPRSFFLSESNKKALVSIFLGIEERMGFISITGEAGTGKTILIHYLLNKLGKKVRPVLIYNPRISFEDLLKKILRELDFPMGGRSKASLINQFNECLSQRLGPDESLVIFIDEAQNMKKEVMEEMQALFSYGNSRCNSLQIVLIGQPELEINLNSQELRQLNQKIRIRSQIRALRDNESRQYIDHRLKLVGGNSSEIFTPEALLLLCQCGEGIPRTLNVICDNALRIGFQLSREKIDAAIVKMALTELNIAEPKAASPVTLLKKPSFRRITYSGLALIGLVLVLFLGREFLRSSPEKMRPEPLVKHPIGAGKVSTPPPEVKADSPPKDVPGRALDQASSQAFDQAPSTPKPPQPVSASLPRSPQLQPAKKSRLNIIEVKEGATLSGLCQKYYKVCNTTLLDHILEFNPRILNPDLIIAHQKIKIPEITEASLVIESGDGTFKVHLGTFSRPEYARGYKDEPALQGKNIESIPREVSPVQTWYRVVVGKFDTREEALKAIQALKQKDLLPSFRGTLGE